MLDVAERDGLGAAAGGRSRRRPARCSRTFAGENNDAWMAGFTPQLVAAVWMGTDRNAPIRTASGNPISGKDLPGDGVARVHGDATAGRPTAEFAPFRAARRAAFGPAARRRSAQAAGHRDRVRCAQRGRDARPVGATRADAGDPDGTARRRTLGLHVVGALRLVS